VTELWAAKIRILRYDGYRIQTMDPRLFQSSGLNNSFQADGLAFSDYIAKTQAMIKQARIDITPANEATILAANSPFEWQPKTNPERGILLIHGLYDSPYSLQDIGRIFLANDFLVRGILLPGHGTRPGDMLQVHCGEWLKAVRYGIVEMQKAVDELYVMGFSLGGTLAMNQAPGNPAIKGVITIAPAFKTIIPYAYFADWHYLFSWMNNHFKWYQKQNQTSYAKYESFAFNTAHQSRKVMHKTYHHLKANDNALPLMMIATETDESVSTQATLNVFAHSNNPNNQMLLYTNREKLFDDKRIRTRTSFYPEHNILDFSHICLPIAPNNPHYGQRGDYHQFIKENSPTPASSDIFFGAVTKKQNKHRKKIIRLTYNPDFNYMAQSILAFIHSYN